MENLGHSLYDLIHEDDHANVKNSLEEAEARSLASVTSQGNKLCMLIHIDLVLIQNQWSVLFFVA